MVQQNSRLSTAHTNEGRKDKQHGEHPTIHATSAHQQPRRTNDGRTTGRSAVHKDAEGQTEETSQGTEEGASLQLPCGCNLRRNRKIYGGYQTEIYPRREQKNVVSNQKNSEGSTELKRHKGLVSHKWRNARIGGTGRCQERHPVRMQDKIFPHTQCPNHVNSAWQVPKVSIG